MPTKTGKNKSAWSAKDIYDMFVKNYGFTNVKSREIRKAEADKYTIPYIPEKEIMLTTGRYNTGKISINVLDSIYNAAKRTNVPVDIALGLAGRESTLGIGRGFKRGQSISGTDLMSNWQQIQPVVYKDSERNRWNETVRKEKSGQQLNEQDYLDRLDFLIKNQEAIESTKALNENPIDNALKLYQSGKYNPGDKRHTQMVEEDAKVLMSDPAIQKWLKTKTETQMKCGGRRKAQLGLDIREGGIAIPIAPNMYYMNGRSHDNGGIAIGPNNKNGLEVEGGEVVKVGKNDIKVFSSVPLLRGVSPAQLVMGGANPNKVFKAQEDFKDRNRINDDGSHYEIGGEKIIHINNLPSSFRGQLRNGKYVQIGIPPITNKAKSWNNTFKDHVNSLNVEMKNFIMDGIKYGKQILPKPLRKYYARGINILNSHGVEGINNTAQKITQIQAITDEKKAGGIYIKPSKRGTFTAAATKHGMGVQEFASKVLANKEDYSPAMVKKANFARNASRWKKEYGGEGKNEYGSYEPKRNEKGQVVLNPINPQDVKWLHERQGKRGAKAVNEAKRKAVPFIGATVGLPLAGTLGASIGLGGINAVGDVANIIMNPTDPLNYTGLPWTKMAKQADKILSVSKAIDSAVDNSNIINIPVYHGTNKIFDDFNYSSIENIGIHAGTRSAAKQRAKNIGNKKDVVIREGVLTVNKDNIVPIRDIKNFDIYNLSQEYDNSILFRHGLNKVGVKDNIFKKYITPTADDAQTLIDNKRLTTDLAERNITFKYLNDVEDGGGISYLITNPNRVVWSKNRNKEYGGNMIYTINGNIRNGLSVRPKAQYGKEKKINNDTKIGEDGLIYTKAIDGNWYTNGTRYEDSKYYMGRKSAQAYSREKFKHQTKPQFLDEVVVTGTRPKVKEESKPITASSNNKDVIITQTIEGKQVEHPKNKTNYNPLTGETIDERGIVETSEPSLKGTSKVNSKSSSTPRGRVTKTSTPKATSQSTPTIQDTVNKITADALKASMTPKIDLSKVEMPKFDISRLESKKTKEDKAKLNTSSTGGGTQSKDGRWVGQYKTTNAGDWIGLGSNVLGSLASYFITKNAINKMPSSVKPVMAQAAKLKTKYNVEPQLSEIREAEEMNRAAVRRNTQSSNTSLAREQRLMNEARGVRNTLYGQKENIETQLINQDRLNRQSVMRDNVRAYNEYLNKLTATKIAQNEMGVSNINNLISGLTGSVNNILGTIESRRATNNTLRAIAAANPNVDARLIGGFDYYIDPITKKKYNKNQQYVGTING